MMSTNIKWAMLLIIGALIHCNSKSLILPGKDETSADRIISKRVISGWPVQGKLGRYVCRIELLIGHPVSHKLLSSGVLVKLKLNQSDFRLAILTAAHTFLQPYQGHLKTLSPYEQSAGLLLSYFNTSISPNYEVFAPLDPITLEISCGQRPTLVTLQQNKSSRNIRLHKAFKGSRAEGKPIHDIAVILLSGPSVDEAVAAKVQDANWQFWSGEESFRVRSGGSLCTIFGFGLLNSSNASASSEPRAGFGEVVAENVCRKLISARNCPHNEAAVATPYPPVCVRPNPCRRSNPAATEEDGLAAPGDAGGPAFCLEPGSEGYLLGIINERRDWNEAQNLQRKQPCFTLVTPLWHPTLVNEFLLPAAFT